MGEAERALLLRIVNGDIDVGDCSFVERERMARYLAAPPAEQAPDVVKDAARYRWLRPRLGQIVVATDRFRFEDASCRYIEVSETLLPLEPASVDAAIDRAMAQEATAKGASNGE